MMMADSTVRPISPRNVRPGDVMDLWNRYSSGYRMRDQIIELCRGVLSGKYGVELPPEFSADGAYNNYRIGFSQKITLALKLTALFQEQRPALERASASGDAPMRRAGQIEHWIEALLGHEAIDPWTTMIDLGFNEGQYALTVAPSLNHYERAPDFFDTLTPAQFKLLHQDRQRQYTERDGQYVRLERGPDGETGPAPKRRYLRDERGRAVDEPGYSGSVDYKLSRRAWEQERRDMLSRTPPFTVRVLAADDTIPLWGGGRRRRLEGLLVRSFMDREELVERGYVWDARDRALMVQPQTGKPGGQCVLYEYWGMWRADDGCLHPMVAYAIDGVPAKYDRGGQTIDAVYDFYDEFGLTTLPAYYAYGWHFTGANPDVPGAPFGMPWVYPYLGMFLMKDALASGVSIKAWRHGFPGFFEELDAQLMQNPQVAEMFLSASKDLGPREVKPMALTPTVGKITPATSPPLGPEIPALLQEINSAIAQDTPSQAAFGGRGVSSGHERFIVEDQVRHSAGGMVLREALMAWRWLGETLLEMGCKIAERTSVPIPLYVAAELPNKRTKADIIELDPDMVGPTYDLRAYFAEPVGANPAQMQIWMNAHSAEKCSWREMRERGFNDPNPDETWLEMQLDKIRMSDEYQRDVRLMAAEISGDERMADLLRLQAENQVNQNGTPAAAVAEAAGGRMAANALAGNGPPTQNPSTNIPNIPHMMVAGQISGGNGTAAFQRDAAARAGVPPAGGQLP